jgi:hypothetical protein
VGSSSSTNTGSGPWAIAAADFDRDGKLDVAVLDAASHTVDLLEGNGDGTFTEWESLSTGNNPQGMAVADLNGDGSSDIAVTNTADNTVQLYSNLGAGSFPSVLLYITGPRGIVAADVNSDGRPDLVTANPNGSITTFLNRT